MRCILLLLAVFSLAFAPASKPKGENELKKMQGKWSREACTIDGKSGVERPGSVTVTISGDQLTFGTPDDTWKLTLDPAAKPSSIDFRRVKEVGHCDAIQGIYRLEGDTLTICWRVSNEDLGRPTSFDPAQTDVWVQVLKRKKN